MQMQSTAVGWDIYQRTESYLALGMVALVQFLPVILLWLVSGYVADHGNRKRIVMGAMGIVAVSSITLALVSHFRLDYRLIYAALAAVGVARAFQQPAKAALLPMLVPVEHFANAVAWNSSGFHLATVLGPALAGWLIAETLSPAVVYTVDAMTALLFVIMLARTRTLPAIAATGLDPAAVAAAFDQASRSVVGGLRYLWSNPVLSGAISLDMFAVLLGGAATLLPVYAKEILQVGPAGLGWLRAAPGFGALTMAVWMAHRPPVRQAGQAMLWAVAGFGLATIVFGLSRSFALSLGMLFLTGALDNISVVIRHTLVQTQTPNHLRGRVSAVNGLFIGASNELGGFESGLVAHYFGPVTSVVSGGIGTILVVLATALSVPQLRNYRDQNPAEPN
jgi:MFS family permease